MAAQGASCSSAPTTASRDLRPGMGPIAVIESVRENDDGVPRLFFNNWRCNTRDEVISSNPRVSTPFGNDGLLRQKAVG
jgi:hypothetical protein